jgi:hypothetical protein
MIEKTIPKRISPAIATLGKLWELSLTAPNTRQLARIAEPLRIQPEHLLRPVGAPIPGLPA